MQSVASGDLLAVSGINRLLPSYSAPGFYVVDKVLVARVKSRAGVRLEARLFDLQWYKSKLWYPGLGLIEFTRIRKMGS